MIGKEFNMRKVLSFVLIFTMLFVSSIVFASDNPFDKITANAPDTSGAAANSILGVVKFVGYAIAIGMLIYVGIKYVMASANEKADLKSALVKYVIGAILIAGATAVAGWIFEIGGGL